VLLLLALIGYGAYHGFRWLTKHSFPHWIVFGAVFLCLCVPLASRVVTKLTFEHQRKLDAAARNSDRQQFRITSLCNAGLAENLVVDGTHESLEVLDIPAFEIIEVHQQADPLGGDSIVFQGSLVATGSVL
jgi:hypothetical protein